MNRSYISFMLASLIVMQSTIPATSIPVVTKPVVTKQLDSYFTRLKRGLNCYRKKIPCSKEDQTAVYQAASTLIALILIGSGGLVIKHSQSIKARNASIIEQFIKDTDDQNFDSIKSTVAMAKKEGTSLPIELALAQILDKLAKQQLIQDDWFDKRKKSAPLASKPELLQALFEVSGAFATAPELTRQFQNLVQRKNNLIAIAQYLMSQGYNPDKTFELSGSYMFRTNWSIRKHINALAKKEHEFWWLYGYLPRELLHGLNLDHLISN